jgi:methyl-accepting chemotaxis protein
VPCWATFSQSALNVAQQGTQAVEETVSSMEQIRRQVESIAQTILALSEQTQAIGAITTTVSELADQSNLLALNAAIEAARAGEQGKSFAVVAQHVRDLAERSKAATGQVREILEEIQRATNTAVMVTEEGSKGVEAGTSLAAGAGQMIHRIASEVEGGAQSNVQMAAAAHQQTAGVDQIGQAITSIQQAANQTMASTRQAERAARDLHTLAQSLQQTIEMYHL